MIKMNCKQIIKLNFSLLSIIIWLITEMNNSLSKQVRATPAFISTSNTICWMKRFKRASQFDDYTGLYGQYNDGQFSDHQQDYNDDLILHQQYYNNNMIYNNMHQNSYQHKNDFTNSAFDINDDSNIDSSLVGFAGLLSHELSEQYNVARHSDLPKFGEPIQNVTVPVGREAVLQCVIDNLQTYKIAWLRVDTQTILTIQNHVITKNHRMSIMHAEQRAWILRIRDVKESDKGWYMCQINTDPMKSQVGYLDVVVPPDILDFQTSTDMVIHEGSNVTLKCAATGSPVPTITWRRESGELIPTPNGTEVISYNGSFLSMANVNRLTMGAYLCIASNGIPPTVSKRIMLIVHFPPMIWIQNQLVGAAVGQNITLKCQLEAFPKSINYWTKNDTIIVPGERFIPETLENGYKITMRLLIIEVNAHNFGPYRCVAKNSLGDTDGAIKLYHIPQTTTITTTTPEISTNTALINIFNKEQHSNFPQHKHTNKNNVIVNNNNKLERIKSRDEFPQLQQQRKQYRQKFQRHFNGHADATSNVWNMEQGYLSTYQKKQQHRQPEHKVDHFITGEQHYNKNSDHNAQDAEFNNYNYNSVAVGVNYKKSLQHGATNSLILDHNGALQNGAIATSHNLTIVFYLSIYVYTFFHQYIYGNSNKCCRSNTNNNNKNNEQQLHSRAGSTPKYFILLYLFR